MKLTLHGTLCADDVEQTLPFSVSSLTVTVYTSNDGFLFDSFAKHSASVNCLRSLSIVGSFLVGLLAVAVAPVATSEMLLQAHC
jgi:hypothetical protein